jgi:indolepyruvate ferredoxin oxidoreductase beta subunit
MLDYQDAAYAGLYLDRLARVVDAERAAPSAEAEPWAASRETARWLALWMAFDDIVRVADLKCRATRRERVAREVKAQAGELLRVYEHFKPGIPEFAALLPAAAALWLTRWDRARQTRGREPFSLALKIGSHSALGFAALRLLASLRWLRRRGTRFADEQLMIERWLASVEAGTRADAALGHEIALCGRLIKGYGTTNERGKANLLHVVDHLAQSAALGTPAARAAAIRAARVAALADDAGTAFDLSLKQHGAPARPVPVAPIRFVRRAKVMP